MFIERLIEKFGYNTPIFTWEIIDLFPEFSQTKINYLILEAVDDDKLGKIDKGIYRIIPDTGIDIILNYGTIDDIIRKKYITNGKDVYGIYGGANLENYFLLSFQVPITTTIITNKESSANRKINFKGQTVFLKKSKETITKDNFHAYTILELFNLINMDDYFSSKSIQDEIHQYINEKKIKQNDVMNLCKSFSSKAVKNMYIGGIINALAQ